MDLLDELETRVLCGDGAMGTLLMAAGVPLERCFEELCVSDPDRIQAIHEQYIGAGARLIKTNTFGANAVRLSRFAMEDRVSEINHAAAKLAKSAARGGNVYVAGSVGPLGIAAEEAAARGIDRAQCFREQIIALVEGGVDLIFFETFTDFGEIETAFHAKKALTTLPEVCSFACPPHGRLSSGMELSAAFASLRGQGTKMLGVNCMNTPTETVQLLNAVPADFLQTAYPTAGHPANQKGSLVYDAAPSDFARAGREMLAQGVRLIGGCCGTNSTHIAGIAAAIAD
jgi:homocysteine S-methyltransferase